MKFFYGSPKGQVRHRKILIDNQRRLRQRLKEEKEEGRDDWEKRKARDYDNEGDDVCTDRKNFFSLGQFLLEARPEIMTAEILKLTIWSIGWEHLDFLSLFELAVRTTPYLVVDVFPILLKTMQKYEIPLESTSSSELYIQEYLKAFTLAKTLKSQKKSAD